MNSVAERGLPHTLVVAGKPGWLADDVLTAARAADQHARTTFLGYVSPEDLRGLYAATDGFALPSLYEGFGMPALDALAAGIPTMLSDRSALPEVGGPAAIYVNPLDMTQIGQGLIRLLTDVDLRARLRLQGPAQAARFSWDAAAAATLAVLRAAAD
jgi:alpha-1,3-rhamnosyl/mannosyltransferase